MKPPEYLGPYRIGKTLGKGGMGSVYQAEHAKSGDLVAVKVIATQVSDEMRFRRRFNAEIETLKRLSHANIVKLIGYGEEQGLLFYSMEYVPGETLQEMIRRKKKLHWMEAIEIAIQVCAALKHAHDFGVIHRDLKPANLIIQDDGTVKLLDFGISKIFGHEQTAVGSIMGTADYMSPEQANESGVTTRTDLYALGCVMYAMLCGNPPFRGKNITEVINALQRKDPVPLDMIDPDLPEDVVQIVNELLEKSPEDRPPTALAVMNRLKAMHAGLHRMQTLAEKVPESSGDSKSDVDAPSRDTTKKRQAPAERGNEDTTLNPDEQVTSLRESEKVDAENPKRGSDTVAHIDLSKDAHTQMLNVDPSAKTVATDGMDLGMGTVQMTAATASLPQDASGTKASLEDSDAGHDGDTSIGNSGKTHFQTVSDGQVREGFFSSPPEKKDNPVSKILTIAALILALLIGGGFLVQSFRSPTPDELLAVIDHQDDQLQSYQIKNEIDRFLKLYPDHPRAAEIRERQIAARVESAVKRLKLKSKLRTSDNPLYEQAFLDAMALRTESPAKARDQLEQWLVVFKDAPMVDEDQDLGELVQFEIRRLSDRLREGQATEDDPKLIELMQKIDDSLNLPKKDREALLQGIVTLYEGQPWAKQALDRAKHLLSDSQ